MMISSESIQAAATRIKGKINATPLSFDPVLNVYIKWENQQKTGAFKIRGALNKILALAPWEQERGLVAVSAGNHGLGVAYAAKLVGAKATVFIPEKTAKNKEDAILNYGATVHKIAGDYRQAEIEAQNYAVKRGATWVSPYNDAQVIAGQATLGLELIDQIKPFDAEACFVPVSGGALISGIGLAFKLNGIKTRIIGLQSKNSAYFYSLYHYGTMKNIVESKSVADGLTGGVEKNSLTIPLVRSMLDDFILVDEDEIEQAVAYVWYHYQVIIEGSAAVPFAAVLNNKLPVKKPVLIITGCNIQVDYHKQICERWKDSF
ncbi:MAG: threonine/serine dehydratase [Anaerolineaceae bacterium]|nr:threonine/serine dehydratase [Anaerolineaceae bacterium]